MEKVGQVFKVHRGITGGRDDGTYLESRMMESQERIAKFSGDIDRDQKNCTQDDSQISAELLVFQSLPDFFQKKQEINVEVHTEEDHKDRDHRLLIGRITSNTVILDTETAGARCTEGQSQGIKHRHFSHKEQQKLQQRETDIDSIENLGRGLYRGNKTLQQRVPDSPPA